MATALHCPDNCVKGLLALPTCACCVLQAASTGAKAPEPQPGGSAIAAATVPSFDDYDWTAAGDQSPRKTFSAALGAIAAPGPWSVMDPECSVTRGGGRGGGGAAMRDNELFEWESAAAAAVTMAAPRQELLPTRLQSSTAQEKQLQPGYAGGCSAAAGTQPLGPALPVWHATKVAESADAAAVEPPPPQQQQADLRSALAAAWDGRPAKQGCVVPPPPALPQLEIVDSVAASQESFNSEQGFGSPVRRHNGTPAASTLNPLRCCCFRQASQGCRQVQRVQHGALDPGVGMMHLHHAIIRLHGNDPHLLCRCQATVQYRNHLHTPIVGSCISVLETWCAHCAAHGYRDSCQAVEVAGLHGTQAVLVTVMVRLACSPAPRSCSTCRSVNKVFDVPASSSDVSAGIMMQGPRRRVDRGKRC